MHMYIFTLSSLIILSRFALQGRPVNYAYSELMTSEEINERSSKLISFIDLAGHRKYLKTTVQGLTGYSPHYAMLVVSFYIFVILSFYPNIQFMITLLLFPGVGDSRN